jgi:acyl-CoA synthetase (AMP-forming)/AMP-acid ligase II
VPGIPDAPSGDKILACLPFFHIYGLTSLLLNPLYTGVECVVMKRFDLQRWCEIVQSHRITIGYIVPPIVIQLVKDPLVDNYDLSSIRVVTSGAAPLTKELVDAAFARCGIRIKQGYGLTETSPTIFTMKWQSWNKLYGSCGVLVPNMEVKFCHVTSEEKNVKPAEVNEGEAGELWVRGPNVFLGYHNNSAASEGVLTKDGWFRTGDVGFVDAGGNLTITDRAKELIKFKGFQVAPAELEGYLIEHEKVEDVAVVGVHVPESGTEIPRAYIVPKGGLSAVEKGDGDKIVQWMDSRVSSHKRLRGGVKFVDSIPKSPSGKILRRVIREQFQGEKTMAAKL